MGENRITVQRFVEKKEEGLYLAVPFAMPEEVESFRISYAYDRAAAVIDIGLNDSRGAFTGWAGSDRAQLTVSEVNSSPGFKTGVIQRGTWEILLGAYHVPDSGVLVTCTVKLVKKHIRLLRGDVHMHSVASDGALTGSELRETAISQGLDFIAITDHNNYFYIGHTVSDDTLTVIPGVEWTHYKGHMGLLGSARPFTGFTANSDAQMRAVLAEAKKNGAVLSINHPFCPNCGWHFGFDIPFDMVEIWNGGLSPKANLACVSWWDGLLQEGRRVPAVGGSDFHRFQFGHIPAFPCTFAYAKSRSAADILAALRSGSGFVAISPEGPTIALDTAGHPVYPGETLAPGTQVNVMLTGTRAGDQIRLVVNGEETVHPGAQPDTRIQLRMPERGYVRLEVIRQISALGLSIPVMISNPLYVGESL